MKKLTAAVMGFILCGCGIAVAASTIAGRLNISSTITHTGGTASTLTEELGTLYAWGGNLGTLGTNGSATGLSKLYVASASIVATGTNTLDLYGALTDSFGAAFNLARVKLILVAPSNSMAGQTITFRAAAANGLTNALDATGVSVRCGGTFFLAAPDAIGYTVSNGVCDTIEIVNDSTNAAVVKVIIAGE